MLRAEVSAERQHRQQRWLGGQQAGEGAEEQAGGELRRGREEDDLGEQRAEEAAAKD
jgi:hypothetical protein